MSIFKLIILLKFIQLRALLPNGQGEVVPLTKIGAYGVSGSLVGLRDGVSGSLVGLWVEILVHLSSTDAASW